MNARKELWEEIRKRDPDLAKLLTEVKRVFGRSALQVKFIQTGEIQ